MGWRRFKDLNVEAVAHATQRSDSDSDIARDTSENWLHYGHILSRIEKAKVANRPDQVRRS